MGKKVALIDGDPQCNLTSHLMRQAAADEPVVDGAQDADWEGADVPQGLRVGGGPPLHTYD